LFGVSRDSALGVTDSLPLVIYSLGPDRDEWEARQLGSAYRPQVLYDPTNGSISRGDLTMEAP